jgi:hypothetical protein
MSSKKPESLFKEKVFKDLDTLPNCWYEKIQQVTIRGTPDILICANGYFVALELKLDHKSKIDELQVYKIKKILKSKGVAFIVTPDEWPSVFKTISSLCRQQ